MINMFKNKIIHASTHFRWRIVTVIDGDDSYIEKACFVYVRKNVCAKLSQNVLFSVLNYMISPNFKKILK